MRKVIVVFEESAYFAKVSEEEYKVLKSAVLAADVDYLDTFLRDRKPLENPYKVEDSWLLVVTLK